MPLKDGSASIRARFSHEGMRNRVMFGRDVEGWTKQRGTQELANVRALLAADENHEARVVMAEAPHGTAPALQGKDIVNPMAMILACGALLHHAASPEHAQRARASEAIYTATMEVTAAGVRTPDLGGQASTSEVTNEILAAIRATLTA